MRRHAIARAIAGARWNPADGLIGSDQGLWLDPSDMTTLFRDAAGTIPVTAVEQPVGLMKDKSGRGNHAFNPSGNSANFPVLSARYNLLTKTEQFDDAAWLKNQVTATPNSTTAPDGTIAADAIFEAATTAAHFFRFSLSGANPGAAQYRASLRVKVNGRTKVQLFAENIGQSQWAGCTFNLSNNTFSSTPITTGGATFVSASITDDQQGFKVITVVAMSTVLGMDGILVCLLDEASSEITAGPPYAGDTSKGIYIWGADLRVSNDALNQPAYQRVNTATDYDTVGFKPYLRFDGSSTSMQTASINFTATDKMFFCAGLRKLSDAGLGIFAELSANYNTNNGSFFVTAPDSINLNGNYGSASRGNAVPTAGHTAPSYTLLSPITSVLSATHDIIGDLSALRINGSPNGTNGIADKGSGNFGNYPLYIGARAGSSLWFNGRLYQLVVCGRPTVVPTDQIRRCEDFVNMKTRAF